MVYDSIGIFSDSHLPYQHPDTFNFYRAIDDKYKPKIWIHIGDDTDGHAWSYHESSVSLANADLEWDRAKKAYKNFFEIVGPDRKCFVVSSNHGCLVERKGQSGGLPSQILKDAYRRALDAPDNFQWVREVRGKLPDGSEVLFHHGFSSKNTFLVAKERGHHIVTGHHHTELKITKDFIPSLDRNIWAMQVGCTIDFKSKAFEYAWNHKVHPKIGSGVIVDSVPITIPMKMNKNGRWTGEL